ncbi:MAG: hypothetical protein KatS3mg113_0211 [Planctomycetaceae bacterium]|nr:MAG: hypothetical protein KatS3mg113_0211 [Planctomycetaceae bacterium]
MESRTTPQWIHVHDYNEHQRAAVQRILMLLERTQARADLQFSRRRSSERKPFHRPIWIFLSENPDAQPTLEQLLTGDQSFTAWAHSLSQGGLGFITPNSFEETQIHLGLPMPERVIRWYAADVVRKRSIPGEDFFEYGVAFRPEPGPVTMTLPTTDQPAVSG